MLPIQTTRGHYDTRAATEESSISSSRHHSCWRQGPHSLFQIPVNTLKDSVFITFCQEIKMATSSDTILRVTRHAYEIYLQAE